MSIKLETKICKEDLVTILNAYFLMKYNSVIDTEDHFVVDGKDGTTDFRHLINVHPTEKGDELNLTIDLMHVSKNREEEKAA
ncbi:uncharacterized protein METZ01_LOCUS102584 [marine metagenome]|uniref:Uncharacterized protein n=1 Tax=marine metagenome TaxID=408172 RepID=A0A381WB28_9ZZZZ|tara:strand:+ start:144 stop:389 length:246 start_codon:yes stop_codon:yes gene_type:complete